MTPEQLQALSDEELGRLAKAVCGEVDRRDAVADQAKLLRAYPRRYPDHPNGLAMAWNGQVVR